MTTYNLNYKIQPIDKTLNQNILQVQVLINFLNPTVCGSSGYTTIDLFKGKLKVLSFTCSCTYTEDSNFYKLSPTQSSVSINYSVQIGTTGKHGLQGHCSPSLTYFSGDQVFLFPTALLTSENLVPSKLIGSLSIDYDFDTTAYTIVPFRENLSTQYSLCSAPSWHHSYELMKSAYVFGNLSPVSTDLTTPSFKIFSNGPHLNDPTITQQFKALYLYYCNLFNVTSHDLSLVLLDGKNQESLGGCGPHIICASFDPYSLRDWQLLSHRMFHSFMDTMLPLNDFHVPSNLWLTEGLATYYENVALLSLEDAFRNQIGFELDLEFNRLFTRYLYAKLKPDSPFNFPPLAERHIKSACKLEFLHYTYAPLIIKYLEDSYVQAPHQVLKTLLYTPLHIPFSLEQFFVKLLGPAVNYFSMNYLFEDYLLPLWYLKDTNTFTNESLLEEINYFDYLLYTWMRLEMPCVQENFSLKDLEPAHSVFMPTLPLSSSIINNLKTYSLDLYHLLHSLYSKNKPLA